jgi:hypothetical protein
MYELQNRYQDSNWTRCEDDGGYMTLEAAIDEAVFRAKDGIVYGMIRVVETYTGNVVITFPAGVTAAYAAELISRLHRKQQYEIDQAEQRAALVDDALASDLAIDAFDFIKDLCKRIPKLQSALLVLAWEPDSECSLVGGWCNDKGPMVTALGPEPTAREIGNMLGSMQLMHETMVNLLVNKADSQGPSDESSNETAKTPERANQTTLATDTRSAPGQGCSQKLETNDSGAGYDPRLASQILDVTCC